MVSSQIRTRFLRAWGKTCMEDRGLQPADSQTGPAGSAERSGCGAYRYTNGYPPLPTWAHSRMPIDLILSGRAISLFQASHITSMMSS